MVTAGARALGRDADDLGRRWMSSAFWTVTAGRRGDPPRSRGLVLLECPEQAGSTRSRSPSAVAVATPQHDPRAPRATTPLTPTRRSSAALASCAARLCRAAPALARRHRAVLEAAHRHADEDGAQEAVRADPQFGPSSSSPSPRGHEEDHRRPRRSGQACTAPRSRLKRRRRSGEPARARARLRHGHLADTHRGDHEGTHQDPPRLAPDLRPPVPRPRRVGSPELTGIADAVVLGGDRVPATAES